MRPLFTCLIIFCTTAGLFGQDFTSILNFQQDFHTIVGEAEAYFEQKHPGVSLRSLVNGEHRDGEFVKYMRWKSYWEKNLNPDGSIGDPSLYWREKRVSPRAENPFEAVEWTNISYLKFLGGQISLGRTTSMAFHPTDPKTFYVGAAIGGIWKTTDGGRNYAPLGDDLPFMAVSSIVVNQNNPNQVFIAISDHLGYGVPGIGVFQSRDGGATWEATSLQFDIQDNVRIYWMEVDPTNPDKIFVASDEGLFLTTDGFRSVTKIMDQPTYHVRLNPANASIVYVGTRNGGFYRSTNGGESFQSIRNFGNREVYIAVTALNTNKVYIRHGQALHKSVDGGKSFTEQHSFLEDNEVFVIAPNDENILLSGNFETSRSDNNGLNFYKTSQWFGSNNLPLVHVDQRNMFINPLESNVVYYCNDGGIYRYDVTQNSFIDLSNGLAITQYYDIAVSQSNANIIGGGAQDNGNMYRDANQEWHYYATTGDGMTQAIDPTNENKRYWTYQNGELQRWENGTNRPISPPEKSGNGAWETPYQLDPNNPQTIIAGYDRVYRSDNSGDNWTSISPILANSANLNELIFAPSNSNRIYATQSNRLFVKDTTSNNWTEKRLPSTFDISDIEVDPDNMDIIYVTNPGYASAKKVFKSVDAGTTWTNISGSLPNVSTGSIEAYKEIPGALFVGTDAGVYYRDNSLNDWFEIGHLPHTRVEDIEIQYSDQLLRIGTHGRGIFEASILDILSNFCGTSSPDSDEDDICDAFDTCPDLNDNLIGTACDDGDPYSSGEVYTSNCNCGSGRANLSYCAAEGSAGTGSDFITNVQLHTLNNASDQTRFSDFRNVSTTLTAGESYTLEMSLNYSFPPDVAYAWIDYDRNGTFDPEEQIIMSGFSSDHKSTGTITPPLYVESGATTMRVRVIYADPNEAQPCGSYFGEVEDYTVVLKNDNSTVSTKTQECIDTDQDGICDDQNAIEVVPNPSRNSFRVRWQKSQTPNEIHLISLDGKTIQSIEKPQNSNEQEIYWRATDAPGLYILQLITDKGIYTSRVIRM